MLKQSEARRRIIDAWIVWPERPARPTDKHFRRFYEWLARHRPELLAFRTTAEKWRLIRDWLLEIEPGS
jgi:hypothetical protein